MWCHRNKNSLVWLKPSLKNDSSIFYCGSRVTVLHCTFQHVNTFTCWVSSDNPTVWPCHLSGLLFFFQNIYACEGHLSMSRPVKIGGVSSRFQHVPVDLLYQTPKQKICSWFSWKQETIQHVFVGLIWIKTGLLTTSVGWFSHGLQLMSFWAPTIWGPWGTQED